MYMARSDHDAKPEHNRKINALRGRDIIILTRKLLAKPFLNYMAEDTKLHGGKYRQVAMGSVNLHWKT